MTYDTEKYYKTGNIEYLSYKVTTLGEQSWIFSPILQGLYVFRIEDKRSSNIFESNSQNNVTIFSGMCYTLIEDENES